MIPKYIYLYIYSSSTITIHYQKHNPNAIRSSLHARVMFFLPVVAFLVHAFFPKIAFLSALVCFQQVPSTDMWHVLRHLKKIFDLPGDHLEHFLELCCLCFCMHSLLLECVHYLDCNYATDQFNAHCPGLFYMCLRFLCMFQDFYYPLLKWFHLSLTFPLLCLHNGEFCLQFLHVLCPFDALHDGHCLLPLLEVLDSCTYPLLFLVPLLEFLILF
jgi:hypothetical protein